MYSSAHLVCLWSTCKFHSDREQIEKKCLCWSLHHIIQQCAVAGEDMMMTATFAAGTHGWVSYKSCLWMRAAQDADEYAECEATVKGHGPFVEAMKKRGIDDMELVMVDPWYYLSFFLLGSFCHCRKILFCRWNDPQILSWRAFHHQAAIMHSCIFKQHYGIQRRNGHLFMLVASNGHGIDKFILWLAAMGYLSSAGV